MSPHRFSIASGLLLFVGLVAILSIGRWDRGRKESALITDDRVVLNAGEGAVLAGPVVAQPNPPVPAVDRPKNDDMTAKLADVRRELARVTEQLDRKRADIKQLELNPERPRAVLDESNEQRRALEKRIEDLELKLKTTESKAEASQEALDAMKLDDMKQGQRARVNAVAQGQVNTILGRGALLDAQTRLDPLRFRDPAMPAFTPSAAAVAAAGASGGGGGAPNTFPGSTVAGDFMRGEADLMRSAGQYKLASSQAAINVQTANSLAMENRMRGTETFFEMRRVNRAAQALEAGPRPTMEQVVRYASMGLPPRLSSLQLDPVTGDVAWPIVLRDEVYLDDTKYIEKCFRERAAAGSLSYQQFTLVEAAFASLRDSLKQNVDEYPAAKYGEARTFVDSLRYEFQLPVK